MSKMVKDLCVVANLASIVGLTVIALKRNRDACKAASKVVDLEWNGYVKDMQLASLRKELEYFKNSQR